MAADRSLLNLVKTQIKDIFGEKEQSITRSMNKHWAVAQIHKKKEQNNQS